MKTRWLMMTLLLHSGVPALAQLAKDPENPDVVRPDPPKVVRNAVPASAINANTAAVSPAGGAPKNSKPISDCSDKNPCALPTPAAR
jgi:hypothetical protein